ncbi:hypothetical protein JS528_06585 [Bifidobacterium sp. MA2]|uniref:ABC transporter permease n=1 Tax=Bifidobacterium santillanense TaxID=2809028 RepID=A0ABS5UQ65_9BIFI|nr:hypothetical protein [Bifidobacterium santillanense]MBT1173027.1 hypothetical protein [Bifidobacterium santillanense]
MKIAILLDVMVTILTSALFAGMVGSWFPLSGTGAVQVTSANDANVSTLGTVAGEHHVVAAKLVSNSADAGGGDVLLVTDARDMTHIPGAPVVGDTARSYVFGDRIIVRKADELTAPTGRWIVYGESDDVRDFVAALNVRGLKTDTPEIASIRYLMGQFAQTPLAVLPLFVFFLTLAAGLVSSSAMMKRRAIQSFHGMPRLTAVAREICGNWLIECTVMVGAILLLILISGMVWGVRTNRLPFLTAAATSMGSLSVMLMASLLASLSVSVLVTRILDQIKGKRPLRVIMAVSVIALLAGASATSATSAIAMDSIGQASAAHRAAVLASKAPNAYSLSFWSMTSKEMDQYTSRWQSFTDALDRHGKLEIIDYEPQCMLDQLDGHTPETSRPCLIVNPTAARQLGIPYDHEAEDKAQLLLPSGMRKEGTYLTGALEKLVSMERDLADKVDGTRLDDTKTTSGSLPDDLTIRLYTPSAIQANATQLHATTMIVVLPATAISPSNRLAYASQGSVLFAAGTVRQLDGWLQSYNLTGLVASAQNTVEQAQSQVAQAQQTITEFGLMALSTVMGLAIVVATLSDGYCERHRQRLFVQYIHGATVIRRYGPHALIVLVCLVSGSIAVAPWHSSGQWTLTTALIILVGLAAAFLTCAVWDRRMRADTIKQS